MKREFATITKDMTGSPLGFQVTKKVIAQRKVHENTPTTGLVTSDECNENVAIGFLLRRFENITGGKGKQMVESSSRGFAVAGLGRDQVEELDCRQIRIVSIDR